jgi:hypothetical protein
MAYCVEVERLGQRIGGVCAFFLTITEAFTVYAAKRASAIFLLIGYVFLLRKKYTQSINVRARVAVPLEPSAVG